VHGALVKRTGFLLPEDGEEGPRLAAAADVTRRGMRWRATDALHLNVQTQAVSLARRRAAEGEVAAAAALLARALILEAQGPLDAKDSDRLLELGEAGARRERPGRRGVRRRTGGSTA
jgi:hypothetical protein